MTFPKTQRTMKLFLFIISILCLIQSFSAKKKYPSHLPRCFRDDPNLNICLVKSGQTVQPLLKDGLKELGIPSMNPLVIPSIALEQGTPKLNFKINLKNYSIFGLDNYTINEFNIDVEKKIMHIIILFGPLVSYGTCNFEGQILITSLKGKGTLQMETAPSIFTIDLDVELIKKHEEKYIQINSVKIIENTFKGKARFENFEGANENIVKIFNKIIDDNSEELSEEIKPAVNKFIEEFIFQTMGEVFGRYSYDEILPLST